MPAVPLDHLSVAAWHYVGTITSANSSTAKDNSDTAVAFTLLEGKVYICQATSACHVLHNGSGTTVTAATGIKLLGDEKIIVQVKGSTPKISVISATGGAADLKVWRLA